MSDYTLHKIWETPPITKSKNNIQSPNYTVSHFDYILIIQPPKNPKDPYRFCIFLTNAPSSSHQCQITVKLLGRKIREFNQTFFFSTNNSQFIINNLKK